MKCEECGQEVKDMYDLIIHQAKQHSDTPEEDLCMLKRQMKRIPQKRRIDINRVHPIIWFSCLLSALAMLCIRAGYGEYELFYLSVIWWIISIIILILNTMIKTKIKSEKHEM